MFMIVEAPGDSAMLIAGVKVSPAMQWANTSLCLVSFFCIIQAVIGVLYFIERLLNIYYYMLVLSILADITYTVMFISTGLTALLIGFALVLSILLKVAGLLIVSKCTKTVRNQYNAELLPHLKSNLARSFGSEAMTAAPPTAMPAASAFIPQGSSAALVPGNVAASYGSLGRRTLRPESGTAPRAPSPVGTYRASSFVSAPATMTSMPLEGSRVSQSFQSMPAAPVRVRSRSPPRSSASLPAEYFAAVPSNIAPTGCAASSRSVPSPPGSRSLIGFVG